MKTQNILKEDSSLNVANNNKVNDSTIIIIKEDTLDDKTEIIISDKNIPIDKQITLANNELREVELREESLNEIVEATPNWMLRFGNIIFLGIIASLIWISFIVQYPDIVDLKIRIVNKNPNQEILIDANKDTYQLLIKNNQNVNVGDVLIKHNSSANFIEVIKLKYILEKFSMDSINYFPNINEMQLGKLQTSYSLFYRTYQEYLSNKNNPSFISELLSAKDRLLSSILQWEEKYLIYSNISGIVDLNDDYLNDEEKLIIKINNKKKDSFRIVVDPTNKNVNDVKIGQKVNISLNNFPYQDYGYIKGKVNSIVWDEKNNKYNIGIKLINELNTNYNQKIQCEHYLYGSAEIITNKKRLIERIIPNLVN